MSAAEVGLEIGVGVWIRCRDQVWRAGIVAGSSAGSVIVEARGAQGRNENIEVRDAASWLARNEELKTRDGAKKQNDLASLAVLNEAEVLHALQERFESGLVYTNTGPILLAVNPFRELPDLYSNSTLGEYVDLPADKEAVVPHIFGVSRAAYQGVQQHAVPQTVLVSGESGAGKTETTKFVMRYLALAGVGCAEASMSKIEHQVLDSIPLLEALGNASTLRNHNSSRFGKYIELHFASPPDSQAARLVGAHMRTYLLEKVRVTSQQKGERSYHIFYQVLAAAARESASTSAARGDDLKIGSTELRGIGGLQAQDFKYLSGGKREDSSATDVMAPRVFMDRYLNKQIDSHAEEALGFDKVIEALDSLGIDSKEVTEFLSAVVAVLHIGNISFWEKRTECAEVDEQEKNGSFDIACRLLGVDREEFTNALCKKTRSTRDGKITSPLPVEKAVESRDALARHLYGTIFAYIVMQVNLGLKDLRLEKGFSKLPFVGVLDIFGFEFFVYNSFEQLCINYTNELLQQYFNEVIFQNEESLYTREGIQWDPLDFPNNSAIVVLIGKTTSGMLPMLDEECQLPQGSSQQWCEKLKKAHDKTKHFEVVRQNKANFVVIHFAGRVEYNCKEFFEKNRDILSLDIVQCMKASANAFIQSRFVEHDRIFGTQESAVNSSGSRKVMKAKQYSVSSEFRNQLDELMKCIRSTKPHFVRCIKPNPRNVPHEFNRKSVVEQLQYQGVLQAIEVSRAGFPMRLSHRQAVVEYRCLAPPQTKIQVEAQLARNKLDVAAKLLFKSLDEAIKLLFESPDRGLLDKDWAVGKSLVFLKKDGIEVISKALRKLRDIKALRIQANWRCLRLRRNFTRLRGSVIRTQCVARRFLAKWRVHRLRQLRYVVILQSAERGRRVRCRFRKRREATLAIQSELHTRILRDKFVRDLRLLRHLQCRLRHHVSRRIERRRLQAAILLQKAWRGERGRRRANLLLADAHRLRLACRRLLARWRYKVSAKLLHPPVEQHLLDGSPGQLYATGNWLHYQIARGTDELQLLRFEHAQLSQQVMEMQRWTLHGCLTRVLETVTGVELSEKDGAQQAAASQPNSSRASDVSMADSDFERWLIERNSMYETPRFVTPRDAPARQSDVRDSSTFFESFFCCANRQYVHP